MLILEYAICPIRIKNRAFRLASLVTSTPASSTTVSSTPVSSTVVSSTQHFYFYLFLFAALLLNLIYQGFACLC